MVWVREIGRGKIMSVQHLTLKERIMLMRNQPEILLQLLNIFVSIIQQPKFTTQLIGSSLKLSNRQVLPESQKVTDLLYNLIFQLVRVLLPCTLSSLPLVAPVQRILTCVLILKYHQLLALSSPLLTRTISIIFDENKIQHSYLRI